MRHVTASGGRSRHIAVESAGPAEQELAETTLIVAALRAGGAITHGTHTLQ